MIDKDEKTQVEGPPHDAGATHDNATAPDGLQETGTQAIPAVADNPARRLSIGRSIRTRLLALLLGLTTISVLAVAFMGVNSIQTVGKRATQTGNEVLRAQAEEYLRQLTTSEAQRNELIVNRSQQDVSNVAQYAAGVFGNPDVFDNEAYWQVEEHVFKGPEGQYLNDVNDVCSAFVPNVTEMDDEVLSQLVASAYLDFVFPATLENDPNTVAIFLQTNREVVRYYPNVSLGSLVPADFQSTLRPPMMSAGPQNNPQRSAVWTPVYEDAAGQGLLVTAVAPFYNDQGEFIGVIGIDVRLGDISANVEAARLLGGGYSFLIDDTGRAIALPEKGFSDILGRDPEPGEFGTDLSEVTTAFAPVLAEMMSGSTGFDSLEIGERELFVAFAPLESTGWSLASVAEAEQMLQALATLQEELDSATESLLSTRILPFGAGILIVIVIVGLLFTNRLTDPIQKLATAAQRIGAGQWDAPLPQTGDDEIGVLAQAFGTMTVRLRELMTGLEQQAADLAERTRELEASQRVTFAASERTSPNELLAMVVNLIRDQFDLYHVQVYIVDEEQKEAVLRESTGYAGRQLLQKKHHIPLDRPALVTKAIKEGEAVLVTDVNEAQDWLPNPLLPDTQSELVVPLKIGDRVIGALDAQGRTPGRFTESTVALFQTMTDQIAFLFENSELVGRITEQTDVLTSFTNQLRTAADIAQRLGTILDPERLLAQLVELLQSRFGLYHAHIYVLDEATGQLTVQAGSGEVGRVLRERGHSIALDAEKSLVARAARERETVVVADTGLEPDFMPNPLLPQTRSEMAVPLVSGDEVLGVLDVQDDHPNRFSETEVDTFSTVAGQVATALQNARLFEERARAEDAFKRAELEKATILDSQVEHVIYEDKEMRILWPNKAACDSVNMTREELEGRYCYEIWPQRSEPCEDCPVIAAMETGAPQSIEKVTPDGQAWFISGYPVHDADGEIVGGIEVTQNITERVKAEQERERFTNQLRTAADLAEQINAILDPDELLQEVVTQLQARFNLYHVHVYLLDEAGGELAMHAASGQVGQTLLKQGHSIPFDREQSIVARAARSRHIVSVEDTSVEPGFMPNPLLPETRSEVSVPITAGDKLLGVIDVQDNQSHRFSLSDLSVFSTLAGQIATALQNADFVEELQRAAERLREVDRLKSEFLASMSHELRTPLNSIIGYTEVMLMGIDGNLPTETMEDLQVIYDNGQHLLRIINDVLDLAKIEAGSLALNPETVAISELLEGVKTNNAGLLLNKPIEMQVEVEENLPTIQADPVRLNQVLNNLVGNAVKFTAEGAVTLRAFRENGWLCLEVNDTGAGISEEDMEKIFDRFTQADSSNARRAEGTGLGLAITRHLVEMHNGTIEVHSQLGAGSTFTVRLPVNGHSEQVEEVKA